MILKKRQHLRSFPTQSRLQRECVLFHLLNAWQLGKVAVVIVAFFSVAIATQFFRQIKSSLEQMHRSPIKLRKRNLSLAMMSLIGCVILIFTLPVPTRINCDGTVAVKGNRLIYSPAEGNLSWKFNAQDSVSTGEIVAEIQNTPTELEFVASQHELQKWLGNAER